MIQALSYYHLDDPYKITINVLDYLNCYHCILLNYTLATHYLLHYLCEYFYTTYTLCKWQTIFNYCTFFSFTCFFCSVIISFSSNYYSSTNKYVCITIITIITYSDLIIEVLNLMPLLSYVSHH